MVWDKELWDHQIEYSWSWEGHDCLDQILCHLIQKLVKSHLDPSKSNPSKLLTYFRLD